MIGVFQQVFAFWVKIFFDFFLSLPLAFYTLFLVIFAVFLYRSSKR